jgi:hypothetical protein
MSRFLFWEDSDCGGKSFRCCDNVLSSYFTSNEKEKKSHFSFIIMETKW